jgi:asparagine synthase (glutamine-hydrolysing)
MCGLVAIIANGRLYDQHRAIFSRSLQLVAHRGEFRFLQETYTFDNLLAGANRLAFTSGAERQPALSPGGRFAVFLNGEIYDFHQSKSEGATLSDTMQLANVLESMGIAAFSMIDGIYAIVVLDIRNRELWLARDSFGVKPLYYCKSDFGIIVASEIKSLALHGFVDEVTEVPPGSRICVSLTDLKISEFAASGYQVNADEVCHDVESFASRLFEELQAAVLTQTSDGQQYAIFLSGGLDSSSIYALCKANKLQVCPIVLGNRASSDLHFARLLCRQFDSDLTIVPCPSEAELSRILHTVIYFCESFEPNVVRQSALSWILAQGTYANGFRVALCGEGADELFGGYPEFCQDIGSFVATRRQFLNDLHRTQLQRVDRMNMAAAIEVRVPFLSRRVSRLALSNGDPEMYVRNCGGKIETNGFFELRCESFCQKKSFGDQRSF